MAAVKTLSVLSELDVHMSLTKHGIGVTISGDDCETSFSEYPWEELVNDMIEAHAVPVLQENDYRISRDSFNYIRDCSQKMRREANSLWQRIEDMQIVGDKLN
jgi:hypothetical protein